MGSVSDRLGSSRAKLAYIVDSTSAPLAGFACCPRGLDTRLILGSQRQALGLDLNGYTFRESRLSLVLLLV